MPWFVALFGTLAFASLSLGLGLLFVAGDQGMWGLNAFCDQSLEPLWSFQPRAAQRVAAFSAKLPLAPPFDVALMKAEAI